MTDAGIYMLVNRVNGKRYVGSSRNCSRRKSEHISRLRRGVHVNSKLQAAWDKYGECSFDFVVTFSVLKTDEIESIEQEFLDDMQAVATGYNLAPVAGNTAGWKAPPETRKRMSEAAKKRDNSAQLAAMRANYRKRTPEETAKIWVTRRLNAKPLSQETRDRMSASAKARGSNITPGHQELLRSMAIARARFTPAQMNEMRAMKDAGATLKQIGAKYGVMAQSTVSLYVRKARAC